MTKLAEWLCALILCITLWFNLLTGRLPLPSCLSLEQVFYAPFAAVAIVAVVVLATLIRRVQTFKDAPEAAQELRAQIVIAREDLALKGFKFE